MKLRALERRTFSLRAEPRYTSIELWVTKKKKQDPSLWSFYGFLTCLALFGFHRVFVAVAEWACHTQQLHI